MLWSEVVSRLVQRQKASQYAAQSREILKYGLNHDIFSLFSSFGWFVPVSLAVFLSFFEESRLCIVQEELTALEITNIIMRQAERPLLAPCKLMESSQSVRTISSLGLPTIMPSSNGFKQKETLGRIVTLEFTNEM